MSRSRTSRFALAVLGLALPLLPLIPATVGAASPYPPNTVVSTYFDARFCGDGQISVVSDSGGNLVDICAATGQRIDPGAYAAPGYGYGYAPGYGTGSVAPVYGGAVNGQVIRRYTDGNANCPGGDVTQTVAGFYCTANGQPAASSLSYPALNGGYVPTATSGFVPTYTPGGVPAYNYGNAPGYSYGYNGAAALRQYTDDRSNCPNGEVTETASGFYCTTNGQPAFRVG